MGRPACHVLRSDLIDGDDRELLQHYLSGTRRAILGATNSAVLVCAYHQPSGGCRLDVGEQTVCRVDRLGL